MTRLDEATHARPELLPWSDAGTRSRLRELVATGTEFVDAFTPSLSELFSIEHPAAGEARSDAVLDGYLAQRRRELEGSSTLAVFPWRGAVVHLPDPRTYFRLRTSRNRLLVTDTEQARFRDATVAVAGLSVGFSVLHNLVLGGGPQRLRIGDFDRLSVPNLNRLPHSVCDVGREKTELAARRVYELDPYADVTTFRGGIDRQDLYEFLAPGGRPVSLLFEEMDQLPMKFAIRAVARELRIPVVMVSDLGDGTKVDVERFDLEPDRPILHGDVPDEVIAAAGDRLSREEKVRLATAILRPSDMPLRLRESMAAIGTLLPTWPQLGTAVSLAGAAGSYAARRILTGADLPSGRYSLSLDAAFGPAGSVPDPAPAEAR